MNHLINHPSIVQDIIDLALMLPPKGRNAPPTLNPVRRFLEDVAAVAREIKTHQGRAADEHNAFTRHNREGVVRDEDLF